MSEHRHNVIVVCSWRPWRGYKVHEECVSCGATLDQPGHWWRRAKMDKRYRHLQALNAAECQHRIDNLGSEP